jgi:murein DD-endopeptidase MepM/ murein hydrolase activator NlpD
MKLRIIFLSILIVFSLLSARSISLLRQDSLAAQCDTIANKLSDSISISDQQEAKFQDYLDTLYKNDKYSGIDTFYWDNKMINSGHFESNDMKDTLCILLKDSSKHMYYYHPFKNYITSGFGPRGWFWHFGMDIKLKKGDSVLSAFDGIVRVTKYDLHGFGKVVVIRHPSGIETIYGHLSKVLVNPNQKVKAGDLIGLGGNSGRSTGSHLHFETRYLGEPFDPNCFIDFEKYKLKSDTLKISKNNFEYLVELRKAKYYTIRKGDSLSRIAYRHHTTITAMCKLNHITSKTILRVGRQIRYQ